MFNMRTITKGTHSEITAIFDHIISFLFLYLSSSETFSLKSEDWDLLSELYNGTWLKSIFETSYSFF